MDNNAQLLSLIHKNAAMGTRSIPKVMSLPQSKAMSRALNSQLEEYKNIARASEQCAKRLGHDVAEPSVLSQSMSSVMLRMQTMTDRSTSRLAELMIQGNTMGAILMTKQLNRYRNHTDPEIADLGKKLLATEEHNIQQMKPYL